MFAGVCVMRCLSVNALSVGAIVFLFSRAPLMVSPCRPEDPLRTEKKNASSCTVSWICYSVDKPKSLRNCSSRGRD